MSESGHSQPGMYGQGRRRRRRRDREPGPPGQNLSGPSRDRDYGPRERRVGLLLFGQALDQSVILNAISCFSLHGVLGWKRGAIWPTSSENSNYSGQTTGRKGESGGNM